MQLIIEIEEPVTDAHPVELLRRTARRLASLSSGSRVRGDGTNSGGEMRRIRFCQPRVRALGVAGDAAFIGRDQSQSRGHRLERSDAERFAGVGMHKYI